MAGLADRLGRWMRQSKTGQVLGARLGAAYIRLVRATTRWHVEGEDAIQPILRSGKGFIAAMWHGRLFMSPTWVPKGRRNLAMISYNRDGDLIGGIIHRFDVEAVRGSSYDHRKARNKGGAGAYARAYRELVKNHAVLGITPDGPRGPRMRTKRGVAHLSIQTGCPVVPVTFSARWGVLLRSWDRFLIPFPFGRGALVYGDPLMPPQADDDATVDAFVAKIEAAQTDVTNRADMLCGRQTVPPGPPIERP